LKQESEDTIFYNVDRIKAVATTIITIFIVALFILPIYILWHLSKSESYQNTAMSFGVLLIFTLIVSIELSVFTKAKRHEILGAAAA
jgi:hypothetical protein